MLQAVCGGDENGYAIAHLRFLLGEVTRSCPPGLLVDERIEHSVACSVQNEPHQDHSWLVWQVEDVGGADQEMGEARADACHDYAGPRFPETHSEGHNEANEEGGDHLAEEVEADLLLLEEEVGVELGSENGLQALDHAVDDICIENPKQDGTNANQLTEGGGGFSVLFARRNWTRAIEADGSDFDEADEGNGEEDA